MIRRFFPAAFVAVLLLLQVFSHSLAGVAESIPDLVPIAVAVVAIRAGVGWAAFVGFLSGLVEDSFSTSHLGLNSLAWTIAGAVGGSMRGSLYGNRIALSVLLVALLEMIHEVVFSVIYLWGSPLDTLTRLVTYSLFAVFYSAGLALVLFILLDRLLLEPRG